MAELVIVNTYLSKMERSEAEYNNLKKIEHLRHEVITDKSLSYHDALFKVIIIGDSGKSRPFQIIS